MNRKSVSRRRMLQAAVAATVFAGFSTATFRGARGAGKSPRGFALCLGLNHVDKNAYSGMVRPLGGCVNDANQWTKIAKDSGFYPIPLVEDQARMKTVRDHIKWAAADLLPGDIFLLTVSSHGSQRRDQNNDESDHYDETICLWDGQWVDDDRMELWTRFAPGVRVLMIADCCHSASTARFFTAEEDLSQAAKIEDEQRDLTPRDIGGNVPRAVHNVNSAQKSIEESIPTLVAKIKKAQQQIKNAKPAADVPRAIEGTGNFGEQFSLPSGETSPIRALPTELAEYLSQYDNPFPGQPEEQSRGALRASVVCLSACNDDESAWDDGRSGLFTKSLSHVWDGGHFTGDYARFFKDGAEPLVRASKQHPFLDSLGDVKQFLAQKPFTV